MIMPENRNQFVIDSNMFINNFLNKRTITSDDIKKLQYIVYNKYNENDPLVQNFFNVFSNACYWIMNNDTIKNAFLIPDNLPNYKNQKIVQAYKNTIHPFHSVINDFIYATVYGSATHIKKVIELCNSTGNIKDYTFMNQLIDYFDKANDSMILNATMDRNIYYPIEGEIYEYLHLKEENFTSPRYEEFVRKLKVGLEEDDYDYIDEKTSYKKTLTGNIGELLAVKELMNKPNFIYSARDVGRYAGYDASYYEIIERLREIKSTFKSVNEPEDIIFVGSTERRRIHKYLNESEGNEEYAILRLFLNENNFSIEHVLFLVPIDEYTFIDEYNNVYEQQPNQENIYIRKKPINKC